ncbi:unnamed protein product [Symbiodinium sp. KB8]|nr:unnamed protein product [Symbiodinium sp. KB8]
MSAAASTSAAVRQTAFRQALAKRMTAATLVRTALQQAEGPVTLNSLYRSVRGNDSLVPSKAKFRRSVLADMRRKKQIVSLSPTKTDSAKFTVALNDSRYVKELLALDAERWANVGDSFRVDTSQLTPHTAQAER